MNEGIKKSFARHESAAVPPFARVWREAERQYADSRRSYRRVAGAAAFVAAVLVVISAQQPGVEPGTYIEVADLLGSTSWSAPSDILLPERQFDIYQDIPMLIESTNSAGGSLL
jgi:hypothetical protein